MAEQNHEVYKLCFLWLLYNLCYRSIGVVCLILLVKLVNELAI